VATALNEQILGHHPLDTGNVQSKHEDDMDEEVEPQGSAETPATPKPRAKAVAPSPPAAVRSGLASHMARL
jgi:hypothetical protein